MPEVSHHDGQARRAGPASSDAERLTPLGRFLRGTSLDELPELINVIRGEMSLVGPRPLLTQYLERYTPEQTRRHDVKPGITGWAQINGRNAPSWEQKFAYGRLVRGESQSLARSEDPRAHALEDTQARRHLQAQGT